MRIAEVPCGQVVVHNLTTGLSKRNNGTGVGDLHLLDFSIFYWNLRENVSARLEAFLSGQSGAVFKSRM